MRDEDSDVAGELEYLKNKTANSTFDFSDIFQTEKPSDFDIGMKYTFYALSAFIALVGNLCIIIVILKTKSLRTKFNLYIVNLACADFLMPTFCMWVHLVNDMNEQWVLGQFMCKIHTFVQVTVVCTSVFTLTTVTLDRFLATVFPSVVWITQKYQYIVIIIIWISALGISVPWIIYQIYAEFDWIAGHEVVCQSLFPSLEARQTYYISFFSVVFIFPLLLMFTLIVITVIKGDNEPRNNGIESESYQEMRRKAVYMVLTVIIVFCVCWTPNQSLLLWDVYRDRHEKPPGVKHLHYIALYVAYTSSAINPVIYYLYNKCFRHALRTLIVTRCRGKSTEISVSPETIEEDVEMAGSSGSQTHTNQEVDTDDGLSMNEELNLEQTTNISSEAMRSVHFSRNI